MRGQGPEPWRVSLRVFEAGELDQAGLGKARLNAHPSQDDGSMQGKHPQIIVDIYP